MMAAHGWDEDQRRTLARAATETGKCLTYQALLDIVSITHSELLNSDPTREYTYMTSTTERYRAAASQSASTVEKMADFWTQGSQKLTDYMPAGLPQVNLVPFVERYFEFVQRTVDISRDLTIKWAESAGMLSGAVREQAESVGGLVREQAESAREFAHEQAGKAEQVGKELAREARKTEREQARHAHDTARERYEGLTKAELSDQLGQRDLPKTGNVDELIERLVEADSK